MPNCTIKNISFSSIKRKKVAVNFKGGNVTSDAGALLLREIDKKLGFTESLSKIMSDDRDQRYTDHPIRDVLAQRIYGLALGYEDITDHDSLRKDICFQTAIGRDVELASAPTLSRFDNAATRETAIIMSKHIIEQFINSYTKAPKELVLDFDPTDDKIHGNQENRHYHGYYKSHCFLPLYVFCEDQLLTSYLRPCNIDGAKHAWAILALLVKRFRQQWPGVKIIFRGDGGFCRDRILRWCDKNNVGYITGMAGNNRLLKAATNLRQQAAENFEATGEKQKLFSDFKYAAGSWKYERRIVVKAECSINGTNTRFIVTNLTGTAKELYEKVYCARGDMENRIKEQQLDLFADRTSCTAWWANQFRLLLSSCAYVLVSALRRSFLKGTELAKAQCGTIRLKLLKIGAVVIRNTRKVKFFLSSSYPYQDLFTKIAHKLYPE